MIHALFDTSTNLASFALFKDNELLVEDSRQGQRGASSLLPWVAELIEAEGFSLNDVTQWTVGIGPGSFTGLRVSIAFIKGVCFASGAKHRGVTSSLGLLTQVMGNTAIVIHDGRQEEIIVHKLARKGSSWETTSIAIEKIVDFEVDEDLEYFTTMKEEQFELNPLLASTVFCIEQIKSSGLASCEEWPVDKAATEKSTEPIYVRPPVFVDPIVKKDVSHLL